MYALFFVILVCISSIWVGWVGWLGVVQRHDKSRELTLVSISEKY